LFPQCIPDGKNNASVRLFDDRISGKGTIVITPFDSSMLKHGNWHQEEIITVLAKPHNTTFSFLTKVLVDGGYNILF
jgi:hypothetical protein